MVKRTRIIAALLAAFWAAFLWAAPAHATFDYAPPALGSSAKAMRDDLADELTGINTDKVDFVDIDTCAEIAAIVAGETGSCGSLVMSVSPTLTTPIIGAATATTINKVTITAPATGSTLTIVDGATLTAAATASISGTNTGDQTITLTGDVTGSGTGSFAATIAADSVALGTDTTGNYQSGNTAGAGIAVTQTPAEGFSSTVALDYSDQGASPSLAADACQFTSNATVGGYIVCEGDTADAFETRIAATDPTADRLVTLPNADSNTVQPLTCSGTDKVSAISAAGVVTCTADSGAAGGDSVTVNGAATVDPDFDDATPAAVSGANVLWQYSAGNLSGYLPAQSTTVVGVSTFATTGETETGTSTTEAVNPAGLMAAISGKRTIYVPAGAMIAETTTGCAAGTVESATSLVMYKTMDCDGAGSLQEGVQFMVGMPKSWDEGTLTFRVDWTAASGSGDVIWLLSCAAYSNDDALATANFGSEVSVTDTLTAALDLDQAPESDAVTAGGSPAEGDNLWCRIQRDGDNASDTLNSVDARIIGVRALYSINAFTDD